MIRREELHGQSPTARFGIPYTGISERFLH